MRITIALVLASVLTACSGQPASLAGPSSLTAGSGATFDTSGPSGAGLPPTGDPRNTCSNDAPTMLRANGQAVAELTDRGGPVLLDWRGVVNRPAYELVVERYNVTNTFGTVYAAGLDVTQSTRVYAPGRYRFRVRTRSTSACIEPGLWATFEYFSVAGPQPKEEPQEEEPVCAINEGECFEASNITWGD
jgi:hypothetical protein